MTRIRWDIANSSDVTLFVTIKDGVVIRSETSKQKRYREIKEKLLNEQRIAAQKES